MASGVNFMTSPLVVWVETFLPEGSPAIQYKDLYNGVYLNDVLQQIDPRPSYNNVSRDVEDENTRLLNWDLLINNIRAYYTDVLQQLIVTKMPNIQVICREPDKDSSFEELKKVILLILGCAVQCEKKEAFIENIKLLDIDVQHAIVEHIKEVTDDSQTVLHIDPPEQLEVYVEKMFSHITRLIKERDDHSEVIADLVQERDYYQSQAEGQTTPVVSTSPEKHHLTVELAEFKAKLRRARQELEEKSELLSDLRDELQSNKETINRLRSENLALTQDARAARTYRDELDVYKEKASKVDKYEGEIVKYKEKLDQLEFFKSRVEELRADNAILVDTKTMLSEQLENSHKRVETVIELENQLMNYRQQLEHISAERDSDRGRIQELTEEIARLEFAKKNSMNESATLELELEEARKQTGGKGGTLSDQMQEGSTTKILRLELENQRLLQKVEEMREKTLIENSSVHLELERENQRLAKKVEKLQESSSSMTQQILEFESKQRGISSEKEDLLYTIETVKENAERQVKELEQENSYLTDTLQTLRERTEKTNDLRIKEVEKENKRLHENVSSLTSQVSKLDFDNRQLQKGNDRLQESQNKISVMEQEIDSLEKENSELYQEAATLRLTCEKHKNLEEENCDLDLENRKLCKTVESLQQLVSKKESLEQDNINLTVENQSLQRTLETLKNSTSSTVNEVEAEKEDLSKELQHVKKMLETHRIERAKYEQMEIDLLDTDGENQKISKSLEATARRVQQLEQDNNDLEVENEKLQKTLENLKISVKKLEEVERDKSELESEVIDLSKGKATLEKENKKMKHSLDLKETAIDEAQAKLMNMDREMKSLRKTLEQSKDVSSRVKDLEKENRDLYQQVSVEKKTVTTLREDLFNEKLRTQQLSNDLETLHQELEHIGINRDKLSLAQTSQEDSRYQALESMMEETLTKNMQIKEEKIHALESRLEESKNRNLKLQDEFRLVMRECESLKQRYEEESLAKSGDSPGHRPVPPPKPGNSTREILKLKDHLVDVERSNATLLTENKSLKSHNDSLNKQLQRMESQSSSVQNHVMSLQGQTTSLQNNNARLQVENTTLQSQCASFMSQVTGLQGQLSGLESEHERLINSHEQLQSAHEQLVTDHEALQRLHEQLTVEYEGLISEHGSLKSLFKAAKEEVKDLHEQIDSLLQGKSDVSKIRNTLEREREQLKMELKSLGNLQMDYNRLRDDHDRVKSTHENLNRDFGEVLVELKKTKTEYNNLQLKHTELQGSMGDCKDQIHTMDVEMVKLADRCESMCQMNSKLEEENRALMLQVQTLLNQNQELLTQALDSKDHLGETEKAYLEKLADLRRQKEKLEEKIMEQYKMGRWDISPRKKGGLGSTIVRKAKGLITRAQRSRSRPNLAESPDDSSVGSYGESTEALEGNRRLTSEEIKNRRKSAGYLNDSPKLSSMNKSLAKSTNALNFRPDDTSQFRGARSTEDITKCDISLNNKLCAEKDLHIPHYNGNSTKHSPDGRSNSTGEDDGGFRSMSPSPRDNGRLSPGSQMVSLEEFLRESNSSPEFRRRALNDQDTDSRDGSDSVERNSSGRSASQPPPQPRRRAPAPPPSEPPPPPRGRHVSSPPPMSSHDHQDLNVSRMSRISASSIGSSSEEKPEIYNNNNMYTKTSTPKVNNDESQLSYQRNRYNNRPGSASVDPSRRLSSLTPDRSNPNLSAPEPTYASVNNLYSQPHANRAQSKSPAPDYRTWNGRERAMSPQRPPPSPGPLQQQHFTNNLNNRAMQNQNYSSPNRPASALPFHGRKTPVERDWQQQQHHHPGQQPSPAAGHPKPKSYTPQPASRIISAANINRERSSHPNRPPGDYIHKPSPSYPPNYVPITSPRATNGTEPGDTNMPRQLPSTPSSLGSSYGGGDRMTPTIRTPRPLPPDMVSGNLNNSQGLYNQRQINQSNNQGGQPIPTPRRMAESVQMSRSGNYSDVSSLHSPNQTPNKGMNGPEGQRPIQSRQQQQQQQPVVLASRLAYPANGRTPGNQTPTARIQPQTKLNNNNVPLPPKASSPEGEKTGPKENSVWGVGHIV